MIISLRKSKNVTQKQISEITNISERNYQRLEAGTSKPTIDTFIKLADYFDCSIDYLTGRTDNPKINK